MRPLFTILAVALVLSASYAGPPKKGTPHMPPGYTWETNYDQAKLKAAEAGKLLYLDFYTEW
jgi:hypothetical protein